MNVASAFKRFGVVLREVKEAPKDSVWKVPPCDVLFFASDADLSDTLEGLAVCRVLDPLRMLFANQGNRCLTIAYPGSKLVGKKTFFDVLSLSKSVLLRWICKSFARIFLKIGLGQGESITPEYEVFQKVLRRLHPKLILAIDSNPELCRAALGMGIPILEVLHARGYGDVYVNWKHGRLSDLPDGVLAYDEGSAETFGRLLPTLQVANFRVPFELELARRFVLKSPPPFVENGNLYRHVILFTASYDPARPSWPGGLPSDLVDLVRHNHDLFLLVRMHPVMRLDPEFAEARATLQQQLVGYVNCNLDWASSAPLYAVLQSSTLHFSFDSASSFEAADVGLPTYAINRGVHFAGHRHKLAEAGLLVGVETGTSGFNRILAKPSPKVSPGSIEDKISIEQIFTFARSSSKVRRNRLPTESSGRA